MFEVNGREFYICSCGEVVESEFDHFCPGDPFCGGVDPITFDPDTVECGG
jgi:hypothetical protein